MDSKHTPGPWSTGAGNYDAIKAGKGARAFTIAEVTGPHQLNPISSEETFANAKLIAAAPDLLAAAVDALEAINSSAAMSYGDVKALERDDRRAWVRAVKQLSAAIAKARGGA